MSPLIFQQCTSQLSMSPHFAHTAVSQGSPQNAKNVKDISVISHCPTMHRSIISMSPCITTPNAKVKILLSSCITQECKININVISYHSMQMSMISIPSCHQVMPRISKISMSSGHPQRMSDINVTSCQPVMQRVPMIISVISYHPAMQRMSMTSMSPRVT